MLSVSFLSAGCTTVHDTPGPGNLAELKPPEAVLRKATSMETFPSEPLGEITLASALGAALNRHPALAATWYQIEAGRGAVRQAAVLPNPRLIAEMEEFGGSGDFSGTGALSSRIGISQEIPLGGKIKRRVRDAEASAEIAVLEHKVAVSEFRALVEKRFFEVFTLQERLHLQQEQLDLIRKTHEVVTKRVRIGDTSPLDLSKSRIELASAEITMDQTRRSLGAARYALAELWGSKIPDFTNASGEYQPDFEFSEETLFNALEQSPAWLLYEAQLVKADAALDLASAHRIPDIELEGGVQKFNESDNHAFFMGVSIPLPLFDRNRGGITEAMASKQKVVNEKASGCLALHTELQEAWRDMVSTGEAFRVLEREVVPAAKSIYEASGKSYSSGESDILSLLDAQRTWVETRRKRLDLLQELENSRIEINRLIGYGEIKTARTHTDANNNLRGN